MDSEAVGTAGTLYEALDRIRELERRIAELEKKMGATMMFVEAQMKLNDIYAPSLGLLTE